MQGIAALADSLYRNFILRDIVGKVVPGLIVEVGAWSIIAGEPPGEIIGGLKGQHGAVVAALFALAWTLGLVAQTVLDFVKWAVFVRSKRSRPDCYHTFQPASDPWVEEVFARTRLKSGARRELERLVVVKEAAGNLSIALGVFAGTGYLEVSLGPWRWWVGLAILALLVASLLARHFDACHRELRLSALLVGAEAFARRQ